MYFNLLNLFSITRTTKYALGTNLPNKHIYSKFYGNEKEIYKSLE
jgi:hypothetical protein